MRIGSETGNNMTCANHQSKGRFRNPMFRTSAWSILWALGSSTFALWPGCRPNVAPPDLRDCTRIEVHYPAYLPVFADPDLQNEILDAQEKEYVNSLGTWVVADQELIRTFARGVSQGTYWGEQIGRSKSSGSTWSATMAMGK